MGKISLSQGSGGKEMMELIESFKFFRGKWTNSYDDSAILDISDGRFLVFTTDSFIVDPVFFPGGNIGDLAFCGTVNDLLMMGAKPLGLSLSYIIEEGFEDFKLSKITETIGRLSNKYKIPVATGDTKVMEKGKLDKIVINTSGVGLTESVLDGNAIVPGDKIIISGGLGEHAVALLSKRFDYETDIITDSRPLVDEMNSIRELIKYAKDPTRGGLASALNDMAKKTGFNLVLNEIDIPAKKEVQTVVDMLGINLYELASEGRMVCICSEQNSMKVLDRLKSFNDQASIVGTVANITDKKVIVKTSLGKRIMPTPTGRIVPRIC
ncbi:hydrogenase expression/formation protein HypE [Candidatus Woesearchaeota archaeon]|nr:hydrogenase expression/formation protein HypE [Candidatus Woesearchaeota archaeon]